MKQILELQAVERKTIGNSPAFVREKGYIPAIMYGKGLDNVEIALDNKEFMRVFRSAGETSLVEVNLGNKKTNVLIHDAQLHPVTDVVMHADLYIVRMDEEIDTEVPLKFIGESPAVKNLGGTLITSKNHIEVRCLPGNIPHEIEIDISPLETFDDQISVSDLVIPANVEVLTDGDEVVATVNPPRSEEELAALDTAVTEDIESVGAAIEKKETEEETEEEK